MVINWLLSWHAVADIGWLFFLLYLIYRFWQDKRVLQESGHWLIASGRITQFLWTKEGRHLWPKIEYMYQVCDRDFTGEYFFLDTANNNPNSRYARKVAYKAAMAFENDEDIDVYYNPNNPTQSALDVHIPVKLNVIIGLLLFLIFLHVAIILHRVL